MKAYKLTDENGQTKGPTQWGEGVTHTAPGTGNLCSSGWIHTYSHPLLAVLLNPIHAEFQTPRLWECEVSGATRDDKGLKQGWASVTTVREIPLPKISVEQRARFAILCAKAVHRRPTFLLWADRWLSGEDRSSATAWAWAAAWAAEEAADPIDLIALAEEAVEAQAG
ncbi:MAG: hypothetical protein RB191_18570 [Terriglobia bacterium]|nr:hypothetical protein [Terriglobia bacterium]